MFQFTNGLRDSRRAFLAASATSIAGLPLGFSAAPAAESAVDRTGRQGSAKSTILFFLGVVGQLASMCEAICPTSKDDVHPLWGLVAAWFPRVTRCMKQLGCAERAAQLAGRAEEGVPPA